MPAHDLMNTREVEAGSRIMLVHLLSEAGIALDDLATLAQPAPSVTNLALAVLEADEGPQLFHVSRNIIDKPGPSPYIGGHGTA